MNRFIQYSPEAAEGLRKGKPLVALESTIISHGMPYPQNLETAREVEQTVRDNGAVPATIAIRKGKILIGMTDDDLKFFSQAGDIAKASRRDFAPLLAREKDAAVTVAATMICAHYAGIEVFATGGVGGVHRGAEATWDVSADLDELAHTAVMVVCAGVKSILDIPKTLEYLETRGVPVLTVGTDEFPSFYSRESGCFTEYRVDSPEEIACIWRRQRQLGFPAGILVANPIPREHAMNSREIEKAIKDALVKAKKEGITGKAVTPFLLGEIVRLTGGESLSANIALVKNNAALAAGIASTLIKGAVKPA
ncbi:MAG: pseudouridine-5'-phosphate glycosidase [Spirochaetales bacterium]|nr:pseudouridine-5'-phosphate glycosidase [Spirochaetales bacterium]